MIIKKADPWEESSFENLTGQAVKAGQQVKKATDTAAKAVEQDIKEQVLGVSPALPRDDKNGASSGVLHEQQLDEKKQINLSQTRRGLEEINMAIRKIREEKRKKEQSAVNKPAEGGKERKKEMTQKNEKESMLQKMLRGKQGSREVAKGVSG
jgi:hypothetical protein